MTRLVIALAALACGVLSFAAAREEPAFAPGGTGTGIAVLGVAAAWAATMAGLLLSRARREGAFGLLLALAGAAWLLAGASTPGSPNALAFTAALAVGFAAPALMAHALRPPPALAVLGYVFAVAVAGVGQALWFDPAVGGCPACPENLLLLDPDPATQADVMRAGMAGTVAVLAASATVAVARLLLTSRARRAREAALSAPAVLFVAAAGAQLVHGLDRGFVSSDPTDRRLWLAQALALLAAAAGTAVEPLRRRRARAELARLVLSLGHSPEGELRDALAGTLRDPDLRLLYRTDDGQWIDPGGSVAEEPPPAATRLAAGGRVVGALEHRGEAPLEELVSTARLGLEFERLRAAARHQLAELRASRARIVSAGDEERRRLERDLHDGAQQRLVSLMLALRLAQRDAADPEALAWAEEQLRAAVVELRELAHGIYPAVLGEEGLAAALETLAEGDPQLRLAELPDRRLPAPVESAAYLTVLRSVRAATGPLHVAATAGDGALVVTLEGEVHALDRQELEDRAGALEGSFSAAGRRLSLRLPL
jgi:signal transduction histidine kinase